MNRKESIYFVIGIALTAILFTFVLNGSSPWVSMAQISVNPTLTFTHTPALPTATFTPVPPTATFTPVAPTATFTPVPPTATFTPVPPTATPSNSLPIITVDHPVVVVDEGSLAVNSGSAVDSDGYVVALWSSEGSLSGDYGAWHWEKQTQDGPEDSAEVQIAAVDNLGGTSTLTFTLVVNNLPPVVGALELPPSPISVDEDVWVGLFITDPFSADRHVFAVNWGDGTFCLPGDARCSLDEGTGGVGSISASHTYAEAGLYTISVSVTDDDGGTGTSTAGPVVVYDPYGGYVAGGGSIDSPPGAWAGDPSLTGRAVFGFFSRYTRGALVPQGKTGFRFRLAALRFDSTSYDWLVITGSNYARFKGKGTLNGDPGYGFMVWGGDGTSSSGEDTFRIKIWREDTGYVVYDNGMNQAISGGQIKVISGK